MILCYVMYFGGAHIILEHSEKELSELRNVKNFMKIEKKMENQSIPSFMVDLIDRDNKIRRFSKTI